MSSKNSLCLCVCVLGIWQVLPYSSQSIPHLWSSTQGLPFFTLSNFPVQGLPDGLFPSILFLLFYKRSSPCWGVWQASPSLLQTSLHQETFRTFFSSITSQLTRFCMFCFLKGPRFDPRQLSAPVHSLGDPLHQIETEGFYQQFSSLRKWILHPSYSWSNFMLTVSVLCDQTPELAEVGNMT